MPTSNVQSVFGGGSGGVADGNDQAKVSSNDTVTGYLNGKLVAGTNVTFTENNDGGNETLTIAAAGGVTGFTGSQNTASPNNTVNASRLLVDAASTNADMVLQPKGNGAIIATLPDNGSGGGNKRGAYAVDFQRDRQFNNMVAAGNYSVIVGGSSNQTSSSFVNQFIGAGFFNQGNTDRGGIMAGQYNLVGNTEAIVCGGNMNSNYGYRSFIGSGNSNLTNGNYACIVGGNNNQADGSAAIVGGGTDNFANGAHSSVAGGEDNNASAAHSTIGGGRDNVASGAYATVAGGYANTVSAQYATSVGFSNTSSGEASFTSGNGNTASSGYSIAGGYQSVANNYGMSSFASGRFSANGDAQLQEQILRCVTSNNTATLLTGDGVNASTSVALANDTTIAFDILIAARRTDADNESASWRVTGCIDNNAGTTALVGTPTVTAQGDDSGGVWTITVQANNTSDTLEILATGENAKTIRWVAHARCVKVTG